MVELLFCFPMANGRLERVFSSLKLVKTNRRSLLGEDRLDHLVRIAVDVPPLHQWDATDAVQCCFRRQVQDTRAAPTPSTSTGTYILNLEDWDTFIARSCAPSWRPGVGLYYAPPLVSLATRTSKQPTRVGRIS